MNEKIDWLKTLQDVEMNLYNYSAVLYKIAGHLAYVGAEIPADNLREIAMHLKKDAEAMSGATGAKLHEDLHNAQEQSSLLLKAALAGAFRKDE